MDIDLFIQSFGPYGPWVVWILLLASGIGIPIGEEVVNIPAGFLIAKGAMNPWWTLLASYTGIILADMLWFFLCSNYGTRLLHTRFFRKLLHPKRILQAKHQIERRGAWVMVVARFVPSTRTAAITMSGILHMKLWKFLLVEVTCVAITAPAQILLGYLIGHHLASEHTASIVLWLVGIVVVVLMMPAVVGWLIRWRSSKRPLPRAKASWLRKFRKRTQPKPM